MTASGKLGFYFDSLKKSILWEYNDKKEGNQVETNTAAPLMPIWPRLHKVMSSRSMFKGLSLRFDGVHIGFAQIKLKAQCESSTGQIMCRYTDVLTNSGQLTAADSWTCYLFTALGALPCGVLDHKRIPFFGRGRAQSDIVGLERLLLYYKKAGHTAV